MTRHISRCRRRSGEFTHLSDYCSAGAVLAGVWAYGVKGVLPGLSAAGGSGHIVLVRTYWRVIGWKFCAAPAVRERPACEAIGSSFASCGNAVEEARDQHMLGELLLRLSRRCHVPRSHHRILKRRFRAPSQKMAAVGQDKWYLSNAVRCQRYSLALAGQLARPREVADASGRDSEVRRRNQEKKEGKGGEGISIAVPRPGHGGCRAKRPGFRGSSPERNGFRGGREAGVKRGEGPGCTVMRIPFSSLSSWMIYCLRKLRGPLNALQDASNT